MCEPGSGFTAWGCVGPVSLLGDVWARFHCLGMCEPGFTAGGMCEPGFTAGGMCEPGFTAGGMCEPGFTAWGCVSLVSLLGDV